MIWVPYTNNNGQWIASKLLQGFFGAPLESLCEISVTDIACYPAKTLAATYSNSFSISHTKGGLTLPSMPFFLSVVAFSRRSLLVLSMRGKDGGGSW